MVSDKTQKYCIVQCFDKSECLHSILISYNDNDMLITKFVVIVKKYQPLSIQFYENYNYSHKVVLSRSINNLEHTSNFL